MDNRSPINASLPSCFPVSLIFVDLSVSNCAPKGQINQKEVKRDIFGKEPLLIMINSCFVFTCTSFGGDMHM